MPGFLRVYHPCVSGWHYLESKSSGALPDANLSQHTEHTDYPAHLVCGYVVYFESQTRAGLQALKKFFPKGRTGVQNRPLAQICQRPGAG